MKTQSSVIDLTKGSYLAVLFYQDILIKVQQILMT